jgi:hypothetical protein
MKCVWKVSITKWEGKQRRIFYSWFSVCSHEYRRLTNNFYFISGLYPNLAKSSYGWSPFRPH